MANNKKKVVRINFSWFYLLLMGLFFWLLLSPGKGGSANPQKIEWEDVREMASRGDVKEIVFVRNDFEGRLTMKADRIGNYADMFGGNVPKKSPHFVFLVSASFNAEEMFGELNEPLAPEDRFKVVIEKNDHIWQDMLEWILFPVLLIVMWIFMFRGMGAKGGPGAGGGIFNVGKSTGKVAEKGSVKVT
ncbi:MAG: hypothetical protein MJY56_07550, partial [Bacteroidales bacterium]|nr:hypothetical protein [Bacteroidales bacterium]